MTWKELAEFAAQQPPNHRVVAVIDVPVRLQYSQHTDWLSNSANVAAYKKSNSDGAMLFVQCEPMTRESLTRV